MKRSRMLRFTPFVLLLPLAACSYRNPSVVSASSASPPARRFGRQLKKIIRQKCRRFYERI